MTSSYTTQQILSLLQDEAAATSALLAALQQEFAALNSGDSRALDVAVDAKREPLSQLETLEQQRLDWLQSLACQNDAAGMTRALGQLDPTADAHSVWQQVSDASEACRHQNEINGQSIELQQQHVQRTLDLLTGRSNAMVYGRSGKRDGDDKSHPLAKA
jgi:flagellar biosynthesis/type III secretory pathway chaperone